MLGDFRYSLVNSTSFFLCAFGLVHMTRVSETETESNVPETDSTKYCLMPHSWEYLLGILDLSVLAAWPVS